MHKITIICNRLSLFLQAIWSCILYFIIEAISRHSLQEAWTYMTQKPVVFLYNAGILFVTFLLVYLFRKRVFWRVLISAFWLVLGIVNGVLLSKRVTPFTGPDVRNLTEGKDIMSKYLNSLESTLIFVGLGAILLFLLVFFFRSPKYQGKRRLKVVLPLVLAGFAGLGGATQFMLDNRFLSNYFGNIAFAYQDYGYPYCLMTTIFNTGIGQPRDYSESEIRRIQRTESGLPETEIQEKPNIIFLQLESFMDPSLVNYLRLSEDPIPTFHRLMKTYSSGFFKVPVVGAGTVNTEFEAITGMSLHFFGPGEYPYKGILLESTCESAPYILKDLGYSSHAIHNNEANFYARKTVFSRLGFDSFTSEEYMPRENEQNPLGWVKDKILTEEIMKCLKATEGPDYVYTISVQGHGDYPEEQVIEDPVITVSGAPTQAMNNKWEYYVNQIHEMDLFVEELIQELESFPEDVILVMYGDHLPTMDLTVEELENRYLFQTEYVIWDNMGLEKEDENLAAFQIAAEILDRIGIHEGTIFRYHQARRNTRNYQVDMEMLQYDILYGKKYSYEDGKSPYKRTKMRLGLSDVTLDQVELISEGNYSYYIRGTHFTPSCQVLLNGDWYDTVYVTTETLLITGRELSPFDRISVAVRSNSSTRKALSKSYDRAVYALMRDNPWNIQRMLT